MNQRLDQLKRRYTAWMLLAVFVWVSQPVATSFFCHDDVSHDHSAHAAKTQSSEHKRGSGSHGHAAPHTHGASHEGSTHAQRGDASETPQPAHETCCCQPQQTPVTAAAALSYSGSSSKHSVAAPPAAILPVTYPPEAPPAVASRAGPDVPSLYSQLCRSSFSNRAPPFTA